MYEILEYDTVSSFSHTGKITTFQTFKKKLDELTDMINFDEFPSLSLECPSIVFTIQYECYLYDENKSGSSVNELRHIMFTKENLGRYRLTPTLNALVLHLRQALINIYQNFLNISVELFFFIFQKYNL